MIQINDISITDAKRMEWFPVISLQKNNWKLYHPCEVIPCNITNYLIRCQSERYIIKTTIAITTERYLYRYPDLNYWKSLFPNLFRKVNWKLYKYCKLVTKRHIFVNIYFLLWKKELRILAATLSWRFFSILTINCS